MVSIPGLSQLRSAVISQVPLLRSLPLSPTGQLKTSGIFRYAANEALALLVEKRLREMGHQDGWLENIVQWTSPQHYPGFALAKGKGFFHHVLAIAFTKRYAAYQLSKREDGKLSKLELLGSLCAPNLLLMIKAGLQHGPKPVYA